MSSLLKLRRGSALAHTAFIGSEGETTYATDTHELVTHDGATAGGFPGGGFMPAGIGAVATTVQAKLRESVSVLDFGAIGDGVTDDTAAIQAALISGASTVVIRNSHFISYTLAIPSGVTILGHGGVLIASTAAWPRYEAMALAVEKGGFTASVKPMLSNTAPAAGNTNIYVYGLKLIGNLTGPNHLINFRKVTGLKIVDVETYEGLSAIAVLKSTDVFISRNKIVGFRNGGIDTWEGNKSVVISDNLINGVGPNLDGSNIGIFVTSQPTDSTDSLVYSAEDYTVTGNIINDTQNAGIWVGGGASTRADYAKNILISDNIVIRAGANGILVSGGIGVTVSGNSISDVALSGILVVKLATPTPSISQVSIIGNRITNANTSIGTGRGIDLDLSVNDVIVTGNQVTGSLHQWAFRNRGTNSRVHHYGNSFSAGTSGTYEDLGISSVTRSVPAKLFTTTWDAPSVANSAQVSTTVAASGAVIGDVVLLSVAGIFSGMRIWGEVSAADIVTLYLANNTGGAVDPSNRTINIRVEKFA